jgi:arylsulfatase A-like enzyme
MHGRADKIEEFSKIQDKGRRIYAAMTSSLDDGMGQLIKTLKDQGLDDDTLVFFINDNGGATGNHSDNGPLRGMKGSKFEGGIRVPFMIRWPGQISSGKVYEQPVISMDILPTALAAIGAKSKGPKKLDGVNLLPYLSGEKQGPPHEYLFWRRGVAAAARKGKYKLIRSKDNPHLLFNLDADQSETKNIASQHPQIVKQLLAALADWEKDLSPPRWREGDRWQQNQILKHRMEVVGRAMERKYP